MGADSIASRLLDVMEGEILPMTERGVAAGNKVFGAAILRKSDMSVVIAGTNSETDNPLLHGEINTLNQFYEMPDRPPTGDLTFLSTHEPSERRTTSPASASASSASRTSGAMVKTYALACGPR
jgi:tRNA(Arg) A34 adenosine deaminase TadA